MKVLSKKSILVVITVTLLLVVIFFFASHSTANEAYSELSYNDAAGVCIDAWRRCYPKNYRFENLVTAHGAKNMATFKRQYGGLYGGTYYISSLQNAPYSIDADAVKPMSELRNEPTPTTKPIPASEANGMCISLFGNCYPSTYDFSTFGGGAKNMEGAYNIYSHYPWNAFYIPSIDDAPIEYNQVTAPTKAPENESLTAGRGQSTFNFAACHDGVKKCYQKDYDFKKEFGANATNMDEMVKSEKAKGKSVRYFNIPADYEYVHKKGSKIDGFIHSDPNWNRIMVCDVEKKKCYDRTANLREAGYGASNIDQMIEKEKQKGRNMWDYTIPRKFKYYK